MFYLQILLQRKEHFLGSANLSFLKSKKETDLVQSTPTEESIPTEGSIPTEESIPKVSANSGNSNGENVETCWRQGKDWKNQTILLRFATVEDIRPTKPKKSQKLWIKRNQRAAEAQQRVEEKAERKRKLAIGPLDPSSDEEEKRILRRSKFGRIQDDSTKDVNGTEEFEDQDVEVNQNESTAVEGDLIGEIIEEEPLSVSATAEDEDEDVEVE